jgi:hypothetical protein
MGESLGCSKICQPATIGASGSVAFGRHSKGGSRANQKHSAGTSYLSSPDMPSAMFPDRLIRPLPKRSLRSRLSQEAAESIPFPPNPPSSSFPAYAQYGEHGEYLNESKILVQQDYDYCDHDHDHDHDHHHHHYHYRDHHHENQNHPHLDEEVESTEELNRASSAIRRTFASQEKSPLPRTARNARHPVSKASYSGSDGYDGFENTNNKKKRKIPIPGNVGSHHSGLSSELAHLGLNAPSSDLIVAQDDCTAEGQRQASSSIPGNPTLNGARPRLGNSLGRRISGRNPLGISNSNYNVRPERLAGSLATGSPRKDLHSVI